MFNIPYIDMVTVQSWHNTIKVQPVCYSQHIQELILRIFDNSSAIYLSSVRHELELCKHQSFAKECCQAANTDSHWISSKQFWRQSQQGVTVLSTVKTCKIFSQIGISYEFSSEKRKTVKT